MPIFLYSFNFLQTKNQNMTFFSAIIINICERTLIYQNAKIKWKMPWKKFGCWVSGLALVMCFKQHRQHLQLWNFHGDIKSHIDRDRSFRFFYWVGKLHTTGTNHETVPPPIRDMLYFFYLNLRACGRHNIQILFCS